MATATNTKKRKVPKVEEKSKVKRIRPLLDAAQLKEEEKSYIAAGYKIVAGTFCNRGEDPEKDERFVIKRSVVITCAKRGCHETRRVATSDLHQVPMCEVHTEEARAVRKNEQRRNATAKNRPRRPK